MKNLDEIAKESERGESINAKPKYTQKQLDKFLEEYAQLGDMTACMIPQQTGYYELIKDNDKE